MAYCPVASCYNLCEVEGWQRNYWDDIIRGYGSYEPDCRQAGASRNTSGTTPARGPGQAR